MSGKKLDPSLLPVLSNQELAELVRGRDITPDEEMAAKFRRATATTRSDPDSVRYRNFMARRAQEERDAAE